MQNTLFIIPARGGSKGIPNKNIKALNGKPLIYYSIQFARLFTTDENICVSTDSDKIIEIVNQINLEVPFKRPEALATDTASTFEVLHHAIDFFVKKGRIFNKIVLLQPTTPIRLSKHLEVMLQLLDAEVDATVSVNLEDKNPYYNIFEENEKGFLSISKGSGKFTRRQDCPPVYTFNGSIYVFNTNSLRKAKSFSDLKNIKKYVMENKFTFDLDTMEDWDYCEFLLSKNKI